MSPFGVHEDERVVAFIDGPNFYAATKQVGFDIDYKKLREHLEDSCRFVRPYYYTPLSDTEDFNAVKPLVDYLSFNGYKVMTRPLKEFTDGEGRRRSKGNMHVDMAVAVMKLIVNSKPDHILLFSGDGDFRALVEAAQEFGVRVTVVSTMDKSGSFGAMVADELRREADNFVDLKHAAVSKIVAREREENGSQSHRTAPAAR